MTNIPIWMQTCILLWGDDFVAPLSEVLGVNRRTVSRWKTRVIAMPVDIEHRLVAMAPLSDLDRHLGEVIRRVANGETAEEIERELDEKRAAIRRFREIQARGVFE